ncbi:ORC3 [Cervus elaphus hippelaphus]|uniref:ORC3 n=1 Tax=Cervus elaphus hippelaphus TaxID=46360 RepID=A0A212C5Q2_CEREH|nr:ORC3 [Cervus elaphus hippelaphus]
MATTSVSKGCFVFKPNFKKRKISVPIEDYFNKGENASEDSKLRFETYQLIWQQMKSETERLQEELNKNLFDSLIEFLQTSHSGLQKNSKDWSCQIKLREIPTAALVLGVNVTDHDLTLRSLTEVLQNNVTPYVVSLQAKDCPDMKHFLQKLVSQLMDCKVDVQSKEKESDRVTQKNVHYSMDSLSAWYMSVTQKADPKMLRKKRTSSCQCQSPPVVLILKDMESFTTKVLQDFIIISSQHLHEFPLILIFGIATSPVVIHRLLPHAVSSLLCIELFQSLSCKEHLTTVLDKLLLTTQFPFKLSEKVLQTLTNIFLYHDFSIQNFIKGLQNISIPSPSVFCAVISQKPREEYVFYQLINVKTSDVFHHLEGKKRSTYLVYLVKDLGQNKGSQSQLILKWQNKTHLFLIETFGIKKNIFAGGLFKILILCFCVCGGKNFRYVEKQSSEKQVALLTSDKSLKINNFSSDWLNHLDSSLKFHFHLKDKRRGKIYLKK